MNSLSNEGKVASGLGSGVVLVWLWNDLLAAASRTLLGFDLPPTPAEVAVCIAPVIVAWLNREIAA